MRKKYLDNIRWITVMLVVIYHVIYMFNGVETAGVIGPLSKVQYQDSFMYMVYPWFMLVLFVVSGMSARFYLENHTHKEFVKAKTTKLLVPSTIGILVFWWMLGYFNLKISGAFSQISSLPKPICYFIMCFAGTGPLWYIQMLWLFSMALIPFRKIEKDRLWNIGGRANLLILILVTPLIYGASLIGNTPVIVVYRFGIYGVGYLLGYLVFSHDEVINRLEKAWLPLTMAALLLAIIFTVSFWGQPYAEHQVLDTPLCNLFAWSAVLAVLAFMKKWGDFENAFTRWMIKRSWGMYLFHYLPLAACAYYIRNRAIPIGLRYTLVGLSAFLGGLILYAVVKNIPILKWCVCGIKHRSVSSTKSSEVVCNTEKLNR